MNQEVTISSAIERKLILLLCCFAMFKVFLFSAGFPLFNPVDELQHTDTVIKYAKGYLPHKGESVEMNKWVATMNMFYGSPEYLSAVPKEIEPMYRHINDPQFDTINIQLIANHEIHSPPVYYFIAGLWCNLGKLMGLKEAKLLYWVRFLNCFVMGMLIWISYQYCRYFFDEDITYCLGVPMMLASFPNDVFYSISSDVLSPLFSLLALHMLYLSCFRTKSALFYSLTGLLAAMAVLVKLTNATIIVFLVLYICVVMCRRQAHTDIQLYAKNFIIMMCSALLPLALWVGWNWYALGDFTGDAYKMQVLGWSRKAFAAWFDHPLFSWDGLGQTVGNLKQLIRTFWRGEVVAWKGTSIILPFGEMFYLVTTVLFVSTGITRLVVNRDNLRAKSSYPMFSAAVLLVLYVGLLLILSVQFDFGKSYAPSSNNPYFNKGRLIIGCLVPFLTLYISGLDYLLKKLKLKIPTLGAVGCICLITLALPIATYIDLFQSKWNWFHLFFGV